MAALRASRAELNLMLAVDMPFISRTFLEYLIAQAIGAPQRRSWWFRARDGGRQPLCAFYRREFAAATEKALRAGRNKIDLLFDRASRPG